MKISYAKSNTFNKIEYRYTYQKLQNTKIKINVFLKLALVYLNVTLK